MLLRLGECSSVKSAAHLRSNADRDEEGGVMAEPTDAGDNDEGEGGRIRGWHGRRRQCV